MPSSRRNSQADDRTAPSPWIPMVRPPTPPPSLPSDQLRELEDTYSRSGLRKGSAAAGTKRKSSSQIPGAPPFTWDYYNRDAVRLPSIPSRSSTMKATGCRCCCSGCLRPAIIVFTIIFLILGLLVVGAGVWFLLDARVWSNHQVAKIGGADAGRYAAILTYAVLGVGGAMFLGNLFGLFGAAARNRCLIITYMVLVSITLLGIGGAAVLSFMHQRWLGDELLNNMMDFLRNDYDGGISLTSKAWDTMHVNLKCCGVNGRDDWINEDSTWYNTSGAAQNWPWPRSCCFLTGNDPDDDVIDAVQCRLGGSTNSATCYTELTEWFRTWGLAMGAGMIGIFAIQMIIVILSGLLQSAVNEKPGSVGPYP